MTNRAAIVLLGLVGVWPLWLLPSHASALALLMYLPFFFALGLPIARSFLDFDERDPLFVPFSLLSGIVLAGEAHLALLHVRGARWSPGRPSA